ncbi:3-hydroxyacyl-CoA dehydrogenase family protein [Streptomyces sp. SRF1]|uniref:3-hydroxyacyl-CoA dehydrogenase family protein n=1 Tax=Streptomyces sp. SRF1 TaxID=1549642 RepID=UPI0025B0A6C2|nr:3-hydroxyacyl-CoA dehydrogenase family protein [Streptomyces sp. SRF1]MDN3058993.1 3-hydroxyacyl-CoA dehydrogenase family protein [Streptomyces sp. SRF1]
MAVAFPDHVGVYGGGRMGAGIAHAFLLGGARVTVIETGEAAIAAARTRVERSIAQARARGLLDGGETPIPDRLAVTTDATALADAELVVEAVPENPDLKTDVLRTIEREAGAAVIATNTSSLSIDRLAGRLRDRDRLLGLHFFNPVPASSLVEIVRGSATPDHLVRRARAWVTHLGKTAIVVADSPGFASSRLGVAIALEAMRMVESGVASAEDIDLAMTLGYKHPVGPLRTTDIVGLDVRLAIAEHLAEEVGERFCPPDILRDKVERGELGRKTGRGFFDW